LHTYKLKKTADIKLTDLETTIIDLPNILLYYNPKGCTFVSVNKQNHSPMRVKSLLTQLVGFFYYKIKQTNENKTIKNNNSTWVCVIYINNNLSGRRYKLFV
jgi:hypothetical protein